MSLQHRADLKEYKDLPADDQDAWRNRAPRAGYWLGMPIEHPDIARHQRLQQQQHPQPPPPHCQQQQQPPQLPPPQQYPQFYFGARQQHADHQPHYNLPFHLPPQQYHPGGYVEAPPIQYGPQRAYTPLRQHRGAVGPAQAPAPGPRGAHANRPVTRIKFSFPKNSDTLGARVSRVFQDIDIGIDFEDFFSQACANMDINVTTAELGWKFTTQKKGDAPNQLATADDFKYAMDMAIAKQQRAITNPVEVQIFNLKAPTVAPAAAKKRKAGNEAPGAFIDCTTQLKTLRETLLCQTHDRRHCYVSPRNGEHIDVGDDRMGLWARKIVLGEATFTQPPNDMFFDHQPTKKQRTAKTTGSGTHVEIYNHIPGPSTPLTDNAGQRTSSTPSAISPPSAISSPPSDVDDDDIVFPDIMDALKHLNRITPKDEWTLYENGLHQYGINYVNAGAKCDTTFLDLEVCMPVGLIPRFQSTCRRMTARTRDVYRHAHYSGEVKREDGKENKPIVIA
ncbi:hypothetical protein HWV62_43034 [Athelia sp. TMB]|nr:hypothetical protein HWV62_43034 [Athelia sp. TMB]